MTRAQEAYKDLIQTLRAIPWLNVYEEAGKAGGMTWSLEMSRGATSFEQKIGCKKYKYGYALKLTSPGTTAPDELAENLGVIDDAITADRRRGGLALTTITAEEGWTPEEEEGREAFSISTTLEIHINEVK